MDEGQVADSRADEIKALIQQLGAVEERLGLLTEVEVDAVLEGASSTPMILQQAEGEVRRSRAHLQLILEQLPALVWTTDAELRVTSVSGAVLSEAWLERDDVVGRQIADFSRSGEMDALVSAHLRALEGGSASFELDAGGRTYDWLIEPMRDETGDIVGCVGLAVDVTARAEEERMLREAREDLDTRVKERGENLAQVYAELQVTEDEMRQQNEELWLARHDLEAERRRYAELFEFAPDGYIVTDEVGVIEEANKAAVELVGVSAGYMVGKPLGLYVASDDRGALRVLMEQAAGAGQKRRRIEGEVLLCPRGGDPFPVAASVGAVRDGEGQAVGMRWMVRDISESRRLMKENQRQRLFLERLMDVAPVGIAVVRGEGHRFEMANAMYRSIPGARGPVVGSRFEQVFPGVAAEAGTELLDHVYRTGEAVELRERKGAFVPGEGQSYWDVDVAPLQAPEGDVDGVLMVAHDVSREVRARKDVERLAARTQQQADELSAVFDAMMDAVIVYDGEGVAVRANRAAVEACGLDPVGRGRAWLAEELEICEATGRRIGLEGLPSSRALRGELVEGVQCVFNNAKDGELLIVASAAPLGSDGGGRGAVVVWHDATERERLLMEIDRQRRRAEELAADLRQERDTLQTIMENTHAQLAYLDMDLRFVRVNTAYAEGAGLRSEELIGKGHFDLFPDPENEEIFEEVRETGAAVFFHAKPFVYADDPDRGVTYWDWSLMPVKDDDGAVLGLVLSLLNVTERQRLMEQLAAERAKLHAIIENAPEGIVVADAKGRIVLTNPAADKLYGRPVPYGETHESHARLRICWPDGTPVPPRDLPLTRSALDGEACRDEEFVIVWPEGERRNLLVDTVPIRHRGGGISGAIGIFRDVTERVRVEARVRRYAEQLRVLHEIDVAILGAGSAREIAAESLRGLRELIPSSLLRVELVDVEGGEVRILASHEGKEVRSREGHWSPLMWDRALSVLAEGRPFVIEDLTELPLDAPEELLYAQGVRSVACAPLLVGGKLIGCLSLGRRQAGGLTPGELEIVGAVGDQVAIGIHQAQLYEQVRRHAEELEERVAVRTAQLRASEARLRAIFEQSAVGIALLDAKGRVMTGNPALCEMLGRTREELVGELFARFAHPDEEIEGYLRAFQEVAKGERGSQRTETRYVSAGGETRWANVVLSPVRGFDGEPHFLIAIVEDATEQRHTQAALIRSEKLATTGRLAAALAHEINNPLQAVLGCLGLAKESVVDGSRDELDGYLEMGLEELRRAARIVSRLRDMSRPVDKDMARPADVNELIDGTLKLTANRLDEAHIEVVRRTADGLPKPAVDPDRIKQVLLNLVLNAIEVMPQGGRLEVGTRYDDERAEVCVTVSDSGPGIPKDVLPNLFSPFFSTKDDGMGLGLFVSQNIVEEYGGRVEVESEMGQGAMFTVRLPA